MILPPAPSPTPPRPVTQLVSISDGTKTWVLVLEIHARHCFPAHTQLTLLVHHSALFTKSGFSLTIFISLFGKAA